MSVDSIFEELKTKLGNIAPEPELKYKAELIAEINQLKEQRNAVILGHNYMEPVLFHSIPDFKAGDTVNVHVKIREGIKERNQQFQGTVLQRRNKGTNGETFTVRKVANGFGS